nr:unnamed protein product [Callosobruchus analis]
MSCWGWLYELKFRRTLESFCSVTAVKSMGMCNGTAPHRTALSV